MDTVFESLPHKEATKFKRVIQLYDEKFYKKSLKMVNQLIKKNNKQIEYKMMKVLLEFFLEKEKEKK